MTPKTIRWGFYPYDSDFRMSHDNLTSMQNVIFEKDLLVRDDITVTDDITANGDISGANFNTAGIYDSADCTIEGTIQSGG